MVKKTLKKVLHFFYQVIFNRNIDKKLGNIFFGNENLFSFNLFNKIYLKKISKKTRDEEFIKNYIEDGFAKSNKISENKIDLINEELSKQASNNDGSNRFFYSLNDNLKEKIKNILLNDLKSHINKLKNFYNSNIYVTNAVIFKYYGYNFNKNEVNSYQLYHNDQYLFTYFRLFINLEDVDLSKGPLHIFSVKNSNFFSKKHKYKSRYNYKKFGTEDDIAFKNVGKKGETLFFNTSRCLHRGGIPDEGKTRNMLCILFNAVPTMNKFDEDIFAFEKEKEEDIWSSDNLSKKYGEPKNILTLYKLYKNFKNKMIVND
tara:strand:- start:1863 stop:2810 length:948 start_codon:yes stop_codon:yes gene_type:complete